MTTFTEEWFSVYDQEALTECARSVADLNGAVIEIGSWEGRSTITLAAAIWPCQMHAVDTWEGSPGEISEELAASRDVYATFLANIAEATAGNVIPHRMGWREFMADWTDPIRLVFIDAEHTYTEVRDNILACLPHMVAGGVICGDDAHHPPVRQAVVDTLGNAFQTSKVWHWTKEH